MLRRKPSTIFSEIKRGITIGGTYFAEFTQRQLRRRKLNDKENGKPEFKSGGIYFSISHSENLLAVCFDEYPCGIDIEFMKDRNLKDISKYYGQEFKTLENFYKFWTKQEAEYKLGEKAKYCKSLSIKNYYFTVVSNKIFHSLFFEKFVD